MNTYNSFKNIVVYMDKIEQGIVAFSEFVENYGLTDIVEYKATLLEKIEIEGQFFILIETNQHIKVGKLKYFGKQKIYYILFLPMCRSHDCWQIPNNAYGNADILYAHKKKPNFKKYDFQSILQKHFSWFEDVKYLVNNEKVSWTVFHNRNYKK